MNCGTLTKEVVRSVLDDLSLDDLPDGAYWGVVHERLGLEYGEVFDIVTDDPEFFGYSK